MPRSSRPRTPIDPTAPGRRAVRRSPFPSTLRHAPAILILSASTGLGITLALTADRPIPESEVIDRPVEVTADGYVSSDTCRACHPSEYESWHGSYHRTMTQRATPDTVSADFDGVRVDAVHGSAMQLERREDELWAEFDDPGGRGRTPSAPASGGAWS